MCLPRLEFLNVAKQDDELKNIPIVVLTTSNEERDRINSFNLGVFGYITKPVDYDQFVELIEAIESYCSLNDLLEKAV